MTTQILIFGWYIYFIATGLFFRSKNPLQYILPLIPLLHFLFFSAVFAFPNFEAFADQDALYQDSPGTIIVVGLYFIAFIFPMLFLSIFHLLAIKLKLKTATN